MANAWHKALKNITKDEPMIYGRAYCPNVTDEDGRWTDCYGEFEIGIINGTKRDFAASLKMAGWTYDEDGNWSCPSCSKEGE